MQHHFVCELLPLLGPHLLTKNASALETHSQEAAVHWLLLQQQIQQQPPASLIG
jgi:hypothetical protein